MGGQQFANRYVAVFQDPVQRLQQLVAATHMEYADTGFAAQQSTHACLRRHIGQYAFIRG
ncbi:hypothetical protein D3C75_1178550 [compost metagenome]